VKRQNKNRASPFPGRMSSEATKLVLVLCGSIFLLIGEFVVLGLIFFIPHEPIGLGNVSEATYFVSSRM